MLPRAEEDGFIQCLPLTCAACCILLETFKRPSRLLWLRSPRMNLGESGEICSSLRILER